MLPPQYQTPETRPSGTSPDAVYLATGDPLDTRYGPMRVTGCSSWPGPVDPKSIVSAVDCAGRPRFLSRQQGEWVEVWPEKGEHDRG